MNKNIIIMSIICLFSLLFTISFATETGERIPVKYLKTSDGDTMRAIIDGENVRIRFLGINTPEVSGEDKVEEPFGNEALAYTQKRLDSAKKIEIEYDTVADKEDRFGRKLAWIWVDDELFELELLEQGLAKTYMLKNNYKYARELKDAERKAKNAKLGVWGGGTVSETPTSAQEVIQTDEEEKLPDNYQEENTIDVYDEKSSFKDDMISIIIALIIIVVIILFVRKNPKMKSK